MALFMASLHLVHVTFLYFDQIDLKYGRYLLFLLLPMLAQAIFELLDQRVITLVYHYCFKVQLNSKVFISSFIKTEESLTVTDNKKKHQLTVSLKDTCTYNTLLSFDHHPKKKIKRRLCKE